jgi:hypothetical protein
MSIRVFSGARAALNRRPERVRHIQSAGRSVLRTAGFLAAGFNELAHFVLMRRRAVDRHNLLSHLS